MKVLVIGCGSIGRRHAHNARVLGAEPVVCDLDGARAQEVAAGLGVPRHYTDYREAVEAEGVDAAVVATPTALHVPVATDLAKRGIHLLVEKPLSDSLDGVEALLDVVRRNRVTAMMGYSFRFHEGYLKLRDLLAEAPIGRVYHVVYYTGWYLPDWHIQEDYRREYAARRDMGGGVAVTTLSHSFDIFHWLFGDIVEIIGWKTKLSSLELDVEDSAFCLLRTSGHAVIACVADFLSRLPRHEMVLVGSEGHIHADFAHHVLAVWKTSDKRFLPGHLGPSRLPGLVRVLEDGVAYDPEPVRIRYDFEGNRRYLAEMQYFLARVQAGDLEFDLDLRSGLRVLELLHARQFHMPREWCPV